MVYLLRWLSSCQATWTRQILTQTTNIPDHGSDPHIMNWVQCFGMYIAIVSRHKPADLLGYQRIIMGASLDCREGKWLTYDCRFRLKASASNLKQWSTIDITIWNTTFPERAIRGHRPQGPPPYYQPNSNPH